MSVTLTGVGIVTSAGDAFVDATLGNDANAGTEALPWETVAKVNAATLVPGQSVFFKRGETWAEDLVNSNDGSSGSPITFGAYGAGERPILRSGLIEGDHKVWQDIDIDNAQTGRGLRVENGASPIVRRTEIQNCIDNGLQLANLVGVHLEDLHVHHCMKDSYTGSGVDNPDAHGISIESTTGLTAAGTIEIHHCSGDSVQVDPARDGSDDIDFSGAVCTWWTGPLDEEFNAGWPIATVPGENAIDTKVATGTRMALTLGPLTAYGWQGGIENMAALNIKEGTDLIASRLTVYDSNFAFRLRGGTDNADITLMNAFVYDCVTAFRLEDNINDLKVYNCTLGDGITNFVVEAGGGIGTGADLRNNAFLGTVPAIFSDLSNVEAAEGDFVNVDGNDYRLVDTATDLIDAGDTIAAVTVDRNGTARSGAYEVGAYNGFVSTSAHAYYEMLAAHANIVLTKAFRTEQEIADSYLSPAAGAYEEGRWTYDPVEDACKLTWEPNDGSLGTGAQLRWGDVPSYNEVVETQFGTLGTSTWFTVWEWKFDEHWSIANRDMDLDEVTENFKAFQFANAGDITHEIRFRCSGSSTQFPAASGDQVCHIDIRAYGGGGTGPGNSIPNQIATVYPEAGEWIRFLHFIDGATGEVSLWVHRQGQPIVQLHDLNDPGLNLTDIQGLDSFWFEMNSSQEGGSGIDVESYMWGRNWTLIEGLTISEVEALVAQSSW